MDETYEALPRACSRCRLPGALIRPSAPWVQVGGDGTEYVRLDLTCRACGHAWVEMVAIIDGIDLRAVEGLPPQPPG